MSNEETLYQGKAQEGIQSNRVAQNKSGDKSWKKVVIGGTAGILMGAGGSIAALARASRPEVPIDDDPISDEGDKIQTIETVADNNENQGGQENVNGSGLVPNDGLDLAVVHDNMTFGEAFAEARSQVGPGGVFEWRGALFNTYYAEEWDAMSTEEKTEFAELVDVAVDADAVDESLLAGDEAPIPVEDVDSLDDNVIVVEEPIVASGEQPVPVEDVDNIGEDAMVVDASNGIQVLGVDEYEGHIVAALDVDADEMADFLVIDMDDNLEMSAPDVVVAPDGSYATVEELASKEDSMEPDVDDGDMEIYAHNPEVAEGMPDYMEDGLIDA